MSTNLECRAWERQRKRESRRQASEAQREKGQQRSRARDKNKGDSFLVGKTTWKFCSGGEKMRNPSGHQCKVKMSGSEKKIERKHFSVSTEERFSLITEASSWIHSKTMYPTAFTTLRRDCSPELDHLFLIRLTLSCFSTWAMKMTEKATAILVPIAMQCGGSVRSACLPLNLN